MICKDLIARYSGEDTYSVYIPYPGSFEKNTTHYKNFGIAIYVLVLQNMTRNFLPLRQA